MSDFIPHLEKLSTEQREILAKRLHARQIKRSGNQLAAFVVTHGSFDQASVHDYLASQVPDYMLPRIYVELDELPVTTNGKIDRAILVVPEKKTSPVEMSGIEHSLSLIWSEVLGMDSIHSDDDYFELGGDSITSIQIIAKATHLGLEFSPADLMEHPTVGQLAQFLSKDPAPSSDFSDDDIESSSDDEDDEDDVLRILDLE